jgi:anti-sigma factor RsiW
MKWQCALLQRWLPEYPDGDLPGWGKRWLKAHVAQCPACRREVAELRGVVTAIKAVPAAEPGPEFWRDFSRDMHLKLAQAAHETTLAAPPARRWFRLPYLVGAPVLAVLLLYVAVQLTGPGSPVQNQALVMPEAKRQRASEMAVAPKRTPAPPAPVAAVPPGEVEQIVPVVLEEGGTLPTEEVDISGWDLDSELSGMTEQERETFLKRMHQRAKDGSCVEKYSLCSWG